MAIGNKHKKFGEDRTCSSGDMIVDKQTHTHTHHNRQTDTLIAILCAPYRGGVISYVLVLLFKNTCFALTSLRCRAAYTLHSNDTVLS